MKSKRAANSSTRVYWDSIADTYFNAVNINVDDYHYGPLLPGDSELGLLPSYLNNLRCLELGSGAAQNSVYLAKNGADCTALDISERQIRHAAELMKKHAVDIELLQSSMEDIPIDDMGTFDLIHSSYAMVFSSDPLKVFHNVYRLLNDEGMFLLSNGHPLFAGEWLELEDGETGLFLKDYYNLPPDIRYDDNGGELVRSNYYSISKMFNWLTISGFTVNRMYEPKPVDIDGMSLEEIKKIVPYSSRGWCDFYEQLKHVPGVVIFVCSKK